MPRETPRRRSRRRRRRKNKERKTTSEETNDPPKNESADSSHGTLSIDEIEECIQVESSEIGEENTTENIPCDSTTNAASTSKPFHPALVKPLPGLRAVLETVGGTASVFTRSEIMEYLVKYIKSNELYDVHNPRRVHCENDPLGQVFECKEFSTANVCALLLKNLENVGESDKSQAFHSRRVARKRKREACSAADFSSDSDSSCGSLPPTLGFWTSKTSSSSSDSDATIEFPGTPTRAELEGVEAVLYKLGKLSNIGYETTVVTDSEDDLFYLEEDNDDRFSVEYEPASEDEDERHESDVYMFDYVTDDDMGGDGEDDYDADTEIGEEDYWNCDECNYGNHPMTSQCVSCGNIRRNWLQSETDRSPSRSPSVQIPLLQRSSTAPPSTSSSSDLLQASFPSLPRSTTVGPSPRIETVDNSVIAGLQRSLSVPRTAINISNNSALSLSTSSVSSVTQSSSPTVSIAANNSTGVPNTPKCTCGSCSALNYIPTLLSSTTGIPDSPRTLLSPVSHHSESHDSGFCSGDGGALSTPPVSLRPSPSTSEISSLGQSDLSQGLSDSSVGPSPPVSEQSTLGQNDSSHRTSDLSLGPSPPVARISTVSQSDSQTPSLPVSQMSTQRRNDSLPGQSLLVSKKSSHGISGPSLDRSESADSSNFNVPKDTCIVCLTQPRNASIIHGSTGHQVCCIRCAHHIKNSRNPRCPVCRMAIERVVINFL